MVLDLHPSPTILSEGILGKLVKLSASDFLPANGNHIYRSGCKEY